MLVIVFGLPGTGKTFFASALANALSCIHLNTDILRKESSPFATDYSDNGKEKIYKLMLQKSEVLFKNNQSLIVDGTFIKADRRKKFSEKALELRQKIFFIELKASEAEIRKRVSRKREFTEADFEVYLKLKQEYEPMQEEHLILWSDRMSKEEMLQLALQHIEYNG